MLFLPINITISSFGHESAGKVPATSIATWIECILLDEVGELKLTRWLKRRCQRPFQDFIFIHVTKDVRKLLRNRIRKWILFCEAFGIWAKVRLELGRFRDGISRGHRRVSREPRWHWWLLFTGICKVRVLCERHRLVDSLAWQQRSIHRVTLGRKLFQWYQPMYRLLGEAADFLGCSVVGRPNQQGSGQNRVESSTCLLPSVPLTAIRKPCLQRK